MKLFDSGSAGSLELPDKFINSHEMKNKGYWRSIVEYPTIIEADAEGEESKKHGVSAAVQLPPTLCL